MKKGIKIGYIVKVKNREGMVTYKKDNDNIGINFYNYHQIMQFIGKDKTEIEKRDWIILMGVDEVFCKEEITEIVRNNEIYKQS